MLKITKTKKNNATYRAEVN